MAWEEPFDKQFKKFMAEQPARLMKTLDEHNRERRQWIEERRRAADKVETGVACPDCGNEMVFVNPHAINASIPPSRTVKCPNCERIDYML